MHIVNCVSSRCMGQQQGMSLFCTRYCCTSPTDKAWGMAFFCRRYDLVHIDQGNNVDVCMCMCACVHACAYHVMVHVQCDSETVFVFGCGIYPQSMLACWGPKCKYTSTNCNYIHGLNTTTWNQTKTQRQTSVNTTRKTRDKSIAKHRAYKLLS